MASIGLLCLLPVFGVVAVLIKLDSDGPVFFRQERIGRGFRPFHIYKFRTMVPAAVRTGRPITCGEDSRITRVGGVLRQTKIDELPQLINVLRGDMSIVGPRPELRQYVDRFRDDYAEILTVRPGITDPASLKFRDEASLLGKTDDPMETYVNFILPQKVDLGKQYARQSSLWSDVAVIVKTVAALSGFKVPQ